MRIAQIAPLAERAPPKLYGGTERVVAWLVDELVELGHDVTLFASGDSVTRAKLHSVWPRALRLGRPRSDPIAAQTVLLEAMSQQAAEFDVIHAHIDWLHLPLLSRLGVEIVLDPFLGSGSTLIAAENTGRVCCGIEIDPLYVDVIIRRYEAETGAAVILADSGETFEKVAARRRNGESDERH